MSNLKAQGAKAFVWDLLGKIVMNGMGFIVSIILTRLLEPSDFGLVAMVIVIIGIAGIFGDMGLGAALIQRHSLLPVHYASVFYFNIAVGAFLTLLTFLSAPLIAQFYDNQTLILLTQVISFIFVISAFSTVQRTKLKRELNYALLTKVGLAASLISGIVGVSLAYYGAGVWSLVVQAMTQEITYNVLIWVLSHWKPSAEFSLKALNQLWTFGFRMFLASLLEAIYSRLDKIIIGKLFSPASLGYYDRAKVLDTMVINYSSGSLMSVLFPILSKVQNDLVRFQNIIIKSLCIVVFIVFFLLGGLYLVSYEFIMMLYGDKWLQSVDYFRILVLSGFGYPISALLLSTLSSRGNSKAFLRVDIYKKMIFTVNIVIGFTWGIHGYLYGLIVATSLAVYLNIVFASHEIELSKWQFIRPIIIQAMLTILVVLSVELMTRNLTESVPIIFLIKGFLFMFLYLILNKILGIQSYVYAEIEIKTILTKVASRVRK